MAPVLPLLLLLLLAFSKKTEQLQIQAKDENTDVDLLCADLSVAMNFSNVRLGSIGKNFITSPIVSCLELKNNGISQVDAQTFDGLPNLKYLQISENNINYLDDVFGNNFEHLEVLLLDFSIQDFTYDYYHELTIKKALPKLRKLFARKNSLDKLSVNSQKTFPSLTHLYLSNNDLELDDFTWLPESLEYLDLTSNRLEKVTLKNLPNLKRIYLDQSNEKRLYTILFENLINLNYLSASSNRINNISSETFENISSLVYLDLSDNHITYIEGGSFDAMNELKFLNLSSNSIEILPERIFEKLSKLKVLILEKNSITMFPMIGNPTVIKEISLNCNKIKTIIGGTFAKMPLLETFFLHDNEITNIDQEAFIGLDNLKVLTLSNNKLSVLPQNWMKPLKNLEALDLAGNNFVIFGNLALSPSITLKNVYLSNQILYIETASLIDLPVNATINFDSSFKFVEQCHVPQY